MNRIKEGSTWAGAAGFVAALGAAFPQHADKAAALSALLGIVAGMLPDRGAPK